MQGLRRQARGQWRGGNRNVLMAEETALADFKTVAGPPCAARGSHPWYVVQLRPNCESIARQNLDRQGFETFAPFEQVSIRQGHQFKLVRRSVFPGYIFASLPEEPAQWRSANATYGVAKLVGFQARQPARIPSGFVSDLMARCDPDGQLRPAAQFHERDRVRIVRGPLAGLAATIETIAPQNRIWVLLDNLTSITRVATQADDLRLGT